MFAKILGLPVHSFCQSCAVLVAALSIAMNLVPHDVAAAEPSAAARDIVEGSTVRGGLIVHLGCGDGRLTADLRVSDRFLVHGLARDATQVSAARDELIARGLYGDVAIDQLIGRQLPYADNMVNLLYVSDTSLVPQSEIRRVLVPNGVAVLETDSGRTKIVKPRPDNIDDWTHYLHDSTGNAVAHDHVVGPPRHLQWIGSPLWSRHHDRMASTTALVSANGRIFYVMDEGSRVSIQLPAQWALIARDAFNGTILWKRTIPSWHNHLWPLKSGPTQLARRLVADDQRVYVTLGLREPLSALDAATGEVLHHFAGSQATEEVIHSDGVVVLLANRGESELESFAPRNNVGDQQRVAQEFAWNEQPRQIMAFDARTAALLWQKESLVAPISLAANADSVLLHDGQKVVCLDKSNGQTRWSSPPAEKRGPVRFNSGPRVVIYQDVVLLAVGNQTVQAFDLASGRLLWTAPHPQSAYASPEDLLIVGGLVWSAPTTRSADSGVFTGRDPRTGEVKVEFPPNVAAYWFHHRCYIAKATDRYLIPSRTGIEFVDYQNQDWQINHWVRGGCLYGIMPCNGLVYTPPHDCACYPEAKLNGFNALAPASETFKVPRQVPLSDRLTKGPAYDDPLSDSSADEQDQWPTYRHDAARSGFTPRKVPSDIKPRWNTNLGGRLTSPVIAGDKVYVAQIDAHTLHALDANDGQPQWKFTSGGRIDSPPTIHRGRALFGSADGFVYCLRASDGTLAWRLRAAPLDRRVMALEQLESLWPLSGSVLVQEDAAYCVAGRSSFLDGGMRWLKIDVRSGNVLVEQILDEHDPHTGDNLQVQMQVLNMPVALPDVLSSDGRYLYMRSQRFDGRGNRFDLAPHSGQPARQGSVQAGETAHLFSPTGFLDETWFHRSYWVYGRSFAGGHSGYYQAGKFAPAGRILVFDQQNVYGYGRKPKFYRWTTILEHQLFATERQPPTVEEVADSDVPGSMIQFNRSKSLDPTGQPVAVEAWVNADRPNGVVLARGGPSLGYSLLLSRGFPSFQYRSAQGLSTVTGPDKVNGRWVHLLGMLTPRKELKLYVDGDLVATAESAGIIAADPKQALQIGADAGSAVGDYRGPLGLTGLIDQVNVFHGPVSDEEARGRALDPQPPRQAKLVLSCSFDQGDARDESGNNNHGRAGAVTVAQGRVGKALRFNGSGTAANTGGTNVVHRWTRDIPVFARAMVLAGRHLYVCGPPDLVDEEETFRQLTDRDPRVQALLASQADALDGKLGARLLVISVEDGSTLSNNELPSPPVWDGMASAGGRIYLSTTDGKIHCLSGS